MRWRRGADETRLSWLPATCVGLQEQRTTGFFCVNNVGCFFFNHKQGGYVTLHFHKQCANRFHFSRKLPAVSEGDWLAGTEQQEKEKKEGGGIAEGMGRGWGGEGISLMYVIQSPTDGRMWGRKRMVPYIINPAVCSRWLNSSIQRCTIGPSPKHGHLCSASISPVHHFEHLDLF